jgi:hypothetical protein
MNAWPAWESWAGISVGVHLYPGAVLASTVHPDQDRVVIRVRGENFADVSLFVDRADLDRLVDTVTSARDQLAATATSSATNPMGTAAADAA